MPLLKSIYQAAIRLVKQIWSLPQTVSIAREERRRQGHLDELEAERLDRIRNPSKYLGK